MSAFTSLPVADLNQLHNSACSIRRIIVKRAVADAITGASRMDNASSADIDCDMLDRPGRSVIENKVSGRKIGKAHRRTAAVLGCGVVGKRDPERGEDRHGKSGTVNTACQAGSSPDIRDPHILACIGGDCGSACGTGGNGCFRL